MAHVPTVSDVVESLERRYPVGLAAQWDAVGLVCGDPQASVGKVLWAVDPVEAVVDEAIAERVDIIVTHHPLLLRGVHSVAPTNASGRIVHRLIRHGIGLYCAHTNADHARPGVSDALAAALGLADVRPLLPDPADARCGTGRVGRLSAAMSLSDFADLVSARLPATHHGVRVAGALDARIETVAVCGGSGDAFLEDAAKAADAYVTADLRHHRAQDHLAAGGCALVDVAHWASEWPWLVEAAAALAADLGGTVESIVSTIVTDPWTAHVGSQR